MYNNKSGSGTKLSRSSKKKFQKCRVTKPNIFLKKDFEGVVNPNLRAVKGVSYISYKDKENNKFLKEKIEKILFYPVPSYKSKQYLTKNTIVKTISGAEVKIINLRNGALLGVVT